MASFRNKSVVTQILLGFSSIVALLAVLGITAVYEVNTANNHVSAIRDKWLPSVRYSLEMLGDLRGIRLAEWGVATARQASDIATREPAIDAAIVTFNKDAERVKGLLHEPAAVSAFATIQTLAPQYLETDRQLRDLARAGKLSEAAELMEGASRTIRAGIEKNFKTVINVEQAGADEEGHQADLAYAHSIKVMAALLLAGIAAAIAVALYIGRGLARQLGGEPREAMLVASEIAAGNLRVPVRLRVSDESSLMYSLSGMRQQLTGSVHGIKASAALIATAADEIAQGNTDLSARTEEQAASLEETASSMEQLTAAVRQNADNALQARALSDTASKIAADGGLNVERVVEMMAGISNSSAKVADVISVIEGIAFQTNILALNAAVEAARAGEQGRGFAVVAGEVRTLSQRSAAAAREIKDMIGESLSRVDAGSKLVQETGKTITEVVQAVNRVRDVVNEISSASEEQSTGIEQVNQAVSQMDRVTQQNAALVEQSAASALSMAAQAQSLQEAVAIFQIDAPRLSPR
jgi:methyl-accepting chemotaxis protein